MKWIHPNFPKKLFRKQDCLMGNTSIALLYYINYWVIQIASSLLSFTMKDQTSTTSSWLDCLYWSPTNQYSVNGPQVFLYSPSFIPGNLSWIFCQSTGTDEAETQGWWCRHASSFSLYFTPFLQEFYEPQQYKTTSSRTAFLKINSNFYREHGWVPLKKLMESSPVQLANIIRHDSQQYSLCSCQAICSALILSHWKVKPLC